MGRFPRNKTSGAKTRRNRTVLLGTALAFALAFEASWPPIPRPPTTLFAAVVEERHPRGAGGRRRRGRCPGERTCTRTHPGRSRHRQGLFRHRPLPAVGPQHRKRQRPAEAASACAAPTPCRREPSPGSARRTSPKPRRRRSPRPRRNPRRNRNPTSPTNRPWTNRPIHLAELPAETDTANPFAPNAVPPEAEHPEIVDEPAPEPPTAATRSRAARSRRRPSRPHLSPCTHPPGGSGRSGSPGRSGGTERNPHRRPHPHRRHRPTWPSHRRHRRQTADSGTAGTHRPSRARKPSSGASVIGSASRKARNRSAVRLLPPPPPGSTASHRRPPAPPMQKRPPPRRRPRCPACGTEGRTANRRPRPYRSSRPPRPRPSMTAPEITPPPPPPPPPSPPVVAAPPPRPFRVRPMRFSRRTRSPRDRIIRPSSPPPNRRCRRRIRHGRGSTMPAASETTPDMPEMDEGAEIGRRAGDERKRRKQPKLPPNQRRLPSPR